jgi:hypothetical protein
MNNDCNLLKAIGTTRHEGHEKQKGLDRMDRMNEDNCWMRECLLDPNHVDPVNPVKRLLCVFGAFVVINGR